MNVYMYHLLPHLTQSGETGQTALIKAAWWGHTEVVVELVKAKANMDLQTNVSTCYYDCTCSHVTI